MISITSLTLGTKLSDQQHTTNFFIRHILDFHFPFNQPMGRVLLAAQFGMSYLYLHCSLATLVVHFSSSIFVSSLELFGVLSFGHFSMYHSLVSVLLFLTHFNFLNARSMSPHSPSSRVLVNNCQYFNSKMHSLFTSGTSTSTSPTPFSPSAVITVFSSTTLVFVTFLGRSIVFYLTLPTLLLLMRSHNIFTVYHFQNMLYLQLHI